MKNISLLLILFAFCNCLHAQDFIIKESGDTLFCKITKVEGSKLIYTINGGDKQEISIRDVKEFSSPQNNMSFYDSIPKADLATQMMQLNLKVDKIQLNLRKAHSQYQKGTGLIFASAVVNGATFGYLLLMASDNNSDNGIVTIAGTSLSGLLGLIGVILHIDSHKHIGAAGGYKND